MNLEIKKMSYFDFLMSSYEIEKLKIWISVLVIWVYIVYDIWTKNKQIPWKNLIVNMAPSGFLISITINVFVYFVVYFFKYKRAMKDSPVIKAQVSENFIKSFYIFGDTQKYSMKKYTEFVKIFEKANGFYFTLTRRIALFIPKRGLSVEENAYIKKIVDKYKTTGKKKVEIKNKKKK